ncbi:hypothetical protein EV121DRAFT_284169 [Schizophyllum commune]
MLRRYFLQGNGYEASVEGIGTDHGPEPHQRAQLVEPKTVLGRHVRRLLPHPKEAEFQHHARCRALGDSPLPATASMLAASAACAQRLRGHSTHARHTMTAASAKYYPGGFRVSCLARCLNRCPARTLHRVAMSASGSTPLTTPAPYWQEENARACAESVRFIARRAIARVEQMPMLTSASTEGRDQAGRRLGVLGSRGQASLISMGPP